MKIKSLILIFITTGFTCYSQVFSDDFPGLDSILLVSISGERNSGTITDMYNDGDSILHITGVFNKINEYEIRDIFSWNGNEIILYNNDSIPIYGGAVQCVQTFQDTLYLGGGFSHNVGPDPDPSRNYLTLWNGEFWQGHRLGQPARTVWDMCLHDGKLCIAGEFKYIGGQLYDKIALYNGESWENIGHFSEIPTFAVESLNGELYAAGQAPMGVRHYLGGTEWEDHRVFDDHVYCLKADTFNTFLYAGGMFYRVNGELSRGIAMWDGFKWNTMHYHYATTVGKKNMAIYQGDVYTGNSFTYDEESNTYNYFITRWNGERWDSIGGNFNSTISALEVFKNEIYVGGGFSTYDGQPSKGLRKLTMPDNGCNYIKPRIYTLTDTMYLNNNIAEVAFFNNNPYVDFWEWDFGDGNSAYEKDPVHTYTDTGTYIVSIKVTHESCEKSYLKTIRIEDDPLSSNTESIDRFFDIYPNPSEGNCTVTLLLTDYKDAELRITTTNGHLKTVVPIKSEQTEVNTGNWKQGVYICNLFVKGKLVKSEKIILKTT